MKLKLKPIKTKILEVEIPTDNGEIKELRLIIRKLKVTKASEINDEISKIKKLHEDNEISLKDYLFKTFDILIEDFNPDDFEDMEMEYANEIMLALNKLNNPKESEKNENKLQKE